MQYSYWSVQYYKYWYYVVEQACRNCDCSRAGSWIPSDSTRLTNISGPAHSGPSRRLDSVLSVGPGYMYNHDGNQE